jgi:hypothetical protein
MPAVGQRGTPGAINSPRTWAISALMLSARYLGSCLYLGLRPIAILLLYGGSPGVGDGKNSLAIVGLSFIHLPSRAGISVPFFIVFVLPLLLAPGSSAARGSETRARDERCWPAPVNRVDAQLLRPTAAHAVDL